MVLFLVIGKIHAVSFNVNGISYMANADTAIVKGYTNLPEDGNLCIPNSISYGALRKGGQRQT